MKKIFQSFAKAEFSKKLTVFVFTVYALSFIATNVIYLVFDKNITFIHEYIQDGFTLCLIAYVVKAGAENLVKIGINDIFKSKQKANEILTTKEGDESCK